MLKFFRRIRQQLLNSGQMKKYSLYAIGEIVLVVLGILIALQINNWNENKKQLAFENYILKEIAANLSADGNQFKAILKQRRKTRNALTNLKSYINTKEISKDTFANDLGQLFTFERYFPIKTAYEVSKSKGLPISNEKLRTQIANYYEYEQNKVKQSIEDIEEAFTNQFVPKMDVFFQDFEYGQTVFFKSYPNQELVDWTRSIIIKFKDNHNQSLNKVEIFFEKNNTLSQMVNDELKKFK